MLEKFSLPEHFSQVDKLTKSDSLEMLKKDFPLKQNSGWEVKPLPKVQELPPLTVEDSKVYSSREEYTSEPKETDVESLSLDLNLDDSITELNESSQINEIEKVTIDVANLSPEQVEEIKNGTLEPNSIYQMENRNVYETDDKGRVISKEFDPIIVEDKRTAEDSKNTSEVGKLGKAGDHGGHIQAHSLGGTSDRINLFPQNGNFNMGEYKSIENGIRDDLKNGNDVKVKVELIYNDNSLRPDVVKVTKIVNDASGNKEIVVFTRKNAPKEA